MGAPPRHDVTEGPEKNKVGEGGSVFGEELELEEGVQPASLSVPKSGPGMDFN